MSFTAQPETQPFWTMNADGPTSVDFALTSMTFTLVLVFAKSASTFPVRLIGLARMGRAPKSAIAATLQRHTLSRTMWSLLPLISTTKDNRRSRRGVHQPPGGRRAA